MRKLIFTSLAFCLTFFAGRVLSAQVPIVSHTDTMQVPVAGNTSPIQVPVAGHTGPIMTFDTTFLDMGKVIQGEPVNMRWNFTNTGDEDLVLESVKPSCGCVSPVWPKEPIPPGKGAWIGAAFNSSGRIGQSQKTIAVRYNSSSASQSIVMLSFRCEVILDPFHSVLPPAETINPPASPDRH